MNEMGQHSIGERFGDYKLVRPLGEGGFASVYLGQEVHDGTHAAVKLPKEQQVHNFINELRRTVLLQHPNIVKILDFGIRTPDNTAFIIMEYAPHGSFREKYPRDTRVPLGVVVSTVKQVASALQYAHEQRVIHRDVKPENLLLNVRNMVLLSDFGIATSSPSKRVSIKGQAGQRDITGTYAYTAPEQLKGRPVPASDQYSLAIMVYEWLCGELPFEGQEYIQWLYVHEKEPPPPLRDSVPSLSPDVEQVVLRALGKRPEERFERVETFALALERAIRREDVSVVMNSRGSTTHSTQFDSSPVNKYANVPSPTPSNSIEQLFQEGVRAQASGNAEEAFGIWRRVMTTQGVAERYSTTARNRIRELRTQMIPLRLKQAREASMQGRWQDEIRLWEDLLALEPSSQDLASHLKLPLTFGKETSNPTQSIRERLQIARQNEQSAWMYEGAQQFIRNRDSATARTQLQMLWNDAPYYGDPAGLSKALGLPAILNYEQAIAAEQIRLEQERQERERQEQRRQEQARLERERQEQARLERERQERERQEQARQKQVRLLAKQKLAGRIILQITVVLAVIVGIITGVAGEGIVGIIVGVSGVVGIGVVIERIYRKS
jgi:serine/threonine protein kinase